MILATGGQASLRFLYSMSDLGELVPPSHLPHSTLTQAPSRERAPRGHLSSPRPVQPGSSLEGLRARCEHLFFPGCCSHDHFLGYFILFRVPQN